MLADSRSFHTERFMHALRDRNCHVLLASLEKGGTRHFTLKHRGFIGALHYVLASSELIGLVKRFRPDIINPHFASGYGFTTALARVRKAAPVMLHLWGSDILIVPNKSILHRRKTAYALSHSDYVIGDSQHILDQAERIAKLPTSNIIPWGLDRELLNLHRHDYALSNPPRIIVPRPHENVYNNTFLLRALAGMIKEERICIAFPSWGSNFSEFKRLAYELTGDRVEFYDCVTREKFLEYMSQFDIYLSGAISDSSPASLIEAMGLGLIPVAADIPGVREWLTYDSGFLYDSYQASHLVEVISQVITTGDHQEMRFRNLTRVKRDAIFEENIDLTVSLMRDLIRKRKTK
jgi:glycosyltransferase involved in cell wall biosynthesis